MDITEVLTFADELIFARTGRHLDYLQEAILKGTLEGEKYAKIAEEVYTSEGHLRDVASELWKMLSEELNKDINKANFRAILDSGKIYDFSTSVGKGHVKLNTINICPESTRSHTDPSQPQQNSTQFHLDLGDAPQLFNFYGRTEELATLENWIVTDRDRLIALLGISGIGKTSLAVRLIESIKTNFDYVIYRSLRFCPPLTTVLSNLLSIFKESEISSSVDIQLSQLFNILRQYRCLIILDDVQMLFSPGQLAGYYQIEAEGYSLFFKKIAEFNHSSCVVLNSSEKPREIANLEKANYPVRSLILESLGVAAKEILKKEKLADEESWENFINVYQGNPRWLEITTKMIQELFSGRVKEFLHYDTLIISDCLQEELDQQFQRLTQSEKDVMMLLSRENEGIALAQFFKKMELSPSEFLNTMQSLGRRFLLQINEQEETFFSLNLVWKQSLKNRKNYPRMGSEKIK